MAYQTVPQQTLLNQIITAAAANQLSTVLRLPRVPLGVTLQGKFTYGSGGTSVDAYVQTSLDGSNWIDVAQYHWLLASANGVYNLNGSTSNTTAVVPTDGALTASTSKDGIMGLLWRVKYTSVGTYAGGTTALVNAAFRFGL